MKYSILNETFKIYIDKRKHKMNKIFAFILTILMLFCLSTKASSSITLDESKKYYIHNSETGKYLGFQTGTYTENNKVNATPLDNDATIGFTIIYDADNDAYTISVDGTYMSQSETLRWNTGQSSTAYNWSIEASDIDGYYYIKKNSTSYLQAQTNNGYAYTDGSSTSNCHWEFICTTAPKDYTVVTNLEAGGITYNSNEYKNTDILNVYVDDETLFNPIDVSGYMSNVTVDNTALTITVTYVKKIVDEEMIYFVHNMSTETNKYLSFQSGNYTENNKINSTPLSDSPVNEFQFKYDWETSTYTISCGGEFLTQSSSYTWNTSKSSTSYGWIIEESDVNGFYYIKKSASSYLKSESGNGYAYTNGSSSDNVHWEFQISSNATLLLANAIVGDNLFELDGTTTIQIADGKTMSINDVLSDFDSESPELTEEEQESAIASLKTAIQEPMNYHMPNGRYFIRNHKSFDGFDDTFLSSLGSPIGVVEDALTYWSVWDITNNGDGTFTIVNEGNKNILTPTKTLDNTNPRDDGYLCYDTSKRFKYRVGSDNVTSVVTYRFIPGCILFDGTASGCAAIQPTTMPVNADNEYVYLYMDLENGDGADRRNDHVAKSEAISVVGNQVLWDLYELHTNQYTDALGTHEGESEMFLRMIDELSGHVGGVVTLEDVDDIPCLNAINTATASASSRILSGENGSTYYEEILEQINTIKNDETLNVYYQDLRPEEITEENDTIPHPFFIENLCGSRPTYGARLVEYSWGANPYYSQGRYTWHFGWLTDYQDNVSSDGMFYITRSESKVSYHYNEADEDAVASDYYYMIKNGNGKYLKMYDYSIDGTSNGTGIDNIRCQVDMTEDADSAMHFVITPIIPGIWQIQDIQMTHTGNNNSISETDNVYLTITKAAESNTEPFYGLTHYCLLETSSLWRFVTSNELKPVTIKNLDTSGKTTTPKALYATYSFPINTMVSKTALNRNGQNTHLKPYRCAYAWRNNSRLRVDFVSLPPYIDPVLNDTCYYLEANKGYIIAGYSDLDEITCTTSFVSSSSDVPDSCKLADELNLFVGVRENITIDENNWYSIFALSYNSPDSIIGYYYGSPVKGIGIGFYQLRVGSILPAQSAYIPLSRFADAASNGIDVYDIKEIYVPTNTNVKGQMPVEMDFYDTESNTTFIVEVNQKPFDNAIYDLQGRKISKKPQSGIYIYNGKKYIVK